MSGKADALVIGAGPAGSSTAILLARAGWEVVLIEQDAYPRRKVCGECISAGSLALLDQLGVGTGVRAHAGPELRHVGWMSEAPTLIADYPPCIQGPYRYGRALRREHLDGLLVEGARAHGVAVLQPARVRRVSGEPGAYLCDVESGQPVQRRRLCAALVIDAHGSWQRSPEIPPEGQRQLARRRHRGSDLFAFKAVFRYTRLRPGLLPVMSVPGGYGGMVIADQGLATLACCLRRDAVAACRALQPELGAGEAVEAHLRRSCLGVRKTLEGAQRASPWLTVGPLLPGMHAPASGALFRVGNAACESHPLIGEGISMALQSASLLAHELTCQSPAAIDTRIARELQSRYLVRLHQEFSRRLRLAALYAHLAMRPRLAQYAYALLRRWPKLLTDAARLAGKAAPQPWPLVSEHSL